MVPKPVMKSMMSSTLIIVCGDTSLDLRHFGKIVFVSPLTAWRAGQAGISGSLLGDYSPDEVSAKWADLALTNQIEKCLNAEQACSHDHRWWPLAYRRVMARLSRYRWIKQCITNLIAAHQPSVICLSSSKDHDLLLALQAVAAQMSISVDIQDGDSEPPSNLDHLIRQTGLPSKIDPPWVVRINALWWNLRRRETTIAFQPYWNLALLSDAGFGPIFLNRVVSVVGTISSKLKRRAFTNVGPDLVFYNLWSSPGLPEHLIAKEWISSFAEDELHLIRQILLTFVTEYPPHTMDRVGGALIKYLRVHRVKRVILLHDKLDACRILAWAAHQVGAQVDYLPHGLIFEDASGDKNESAFSPDRILAWNAASSDEFRMNGWRSDAIAHPYFRTRPLPFRPLDKNWGKVRVFVLMADWVYLTQAGREDCAWVWLVQICDGLRSLGVSDRQIFVKMHSMPRGMTQMLGSLMQRVQQLVGMNLQWVPGTPRITELLPNFDLVISGLTTGIYECAMHGIPHILFGMSAQRVGGLKGINVPYARDAVELAHCLRMYNNQTAEHAITSLQRSMMDGIPLERCC